MAAPLDPYHRWLGIPPSEQPPDHYRLLGIQQFEDDPDVIEAAADRQMAHLRTYQSGRHAELSQRLLNEVAAANVCLLNPQSKAAYDQSLRQQMQPPAVAPPPAPAPAKPQLDPAPRVVVAKTYRDTPSAKARVAARARRSRLIALGAVVLAGLSVAGWLVWGPGSDKETAKQAGSHVAQNRTAATNREPGGDPPSASSSQDPPPELPQKVPLPASDFPQPDPTQSATTDPPAGLDQVEPATADNQPESANDGTTQREPVVDEPPPEPKPSTKHPVPSGEAQKEFRRQLDQSYRLDQVRTSKEKLELAGQLLELGKQAGQNATEQFTLLRTAMELASDGGDAAVMLAAVDAIGADFDVDVLEVKRKVLPVVAKSALTSEKIGTLAESSLKLVDEAIAARRYDVAYQVVDTAYNTCIQRAQVGGREHRKPLAARRKEAQTLYELWQEFQAALTTLKTAPDDAEANLAVGRWHCLRHGEWEQGLPHLSRGSDEALKTAAEQELAAPNDAAAQVALADQWWDLAQAAEDDAQLVLLRHAGSWYEKAQPNVTSLVVQDKLERRLEELASRENSTGDAADGGNAEPGKDPTNFDPAAAQLLATLRGHTGSVRSIAFSPNGKFLASGSMDRTVRLWNVAKRELAGALPTPFKNGELRVVYCPKGSLLAVANGDQTASLWDPVRVEFRGMLAGHTGRVTSLAFSGDGSLLATASYDRTIGLWSAFTGQLRGKIPGDGNSVYAVALSPDGSLLASGGSGQPAKLWDVKTGSLKKTLIGSEPMVQCMTFSPDGSILATGGYQQTKLWKVAAGELMQTLAEQSGYVQSVAFSPDGSLLASGGYSQAVNVWDVATGACRKTLTEFAGKVWSVAFSPDGSLLASAHEDGTIRLWGVDPSKPPPATSTTTTAPPPGPQPDVALPTSPRVTLPPRSRPRQPRMTRTGLSVKVFGAGNEGHEVLLNGRPLMQCHRNEPSATITALKPGDVLAVKLGDRFDIMSLWMMFQTPQEEYLFETSERWTAYLPLDSQRWWDVRKVQPGFQQAQYVKDTRQYVNLVQQATRRAVPNHPKVQPITSPLSGENGRGDSYLYYVVTVEDLVPKKPPTPE